MAKGKGQKRREERKRKRQAEKQARVDARRQKARNRRNDKQDAKVARIEARNEGKTARTQSRSDRSVQNTATRAQARETAYEQGINPNQFLSDVGVAGAEMAGDIWGGAFQQQNQPTATQLANRPSQESGSSSMLMLAALGVGAYFLMKK